LGASLLTSAISCMLSSGLSIGTTEQEAIAKSYWIFVSQLVAFDLTGICKFFA
jgi:hypothetical protein